MSQNSFIIYYKNGSATSNSYYYAANKSNYLDNDYHQLKIYTEIKRTNSSLEMWHHYLSTLSILIGIFGTLGNLASLIILVKPSKSWRLSTFSARKGYKFRRQPSTHSNFDHKLANFYTYLTALSFCDFFSCLFSILNMLEHLPPPYFENYSMSYRHFCMSITIITNPIVNTSQALSVWLIVAFSIHRSRSIIEQKLYFDPLINRFSRCSQFLTNFFKFNFKQNSSNLTRKRSFYCLKKFKITCFFNDCWCSKCFKIKDATDKLNEGNSNAVIKNDNNKVVNNFRKFNKVPIIIGLLYVIAFMYLIPQMFEKRLSSIEIHGKMYTFVTITQFGQTRLFRQIFHLWFYLFAIYIIPFFMILLFNFLLLKTYLKSKRRCSQYQLNTFKANAKIAACSTLVANSNQNLTQQRNSNDSNFMNQNLDLVNNKKKPLRDSISCASVTFNQDENIVQINTKENHKKSLTLSISHGEINNSSSSINLNYKHNMNFDSNSRKNKIKLNFLEKSNRPSLINLKTFRMNKRSKTLSFTLFGVSAIFFICHFPAAIAKIIYVIFPEVEFRDKSLWATIILDVSNFLLMVNSSINFLLYIVLGPGKFRQEFKLVFLNFCLCLNIFKKLRKARKENSCQEAQYKQNRSLSFSVTINNLNRSTAYDSESQN